MCFCPFMGVTKCCSEIPSVSYIWIMVFALSCSLSLSIAVPGRNKQHTKMMASHMTLRDNTRKMMASHMTLRDNTPNNNASIKGFNSIINHILGIQTPTFRPSKIWLAPLWRYASRAPNSHVFGCLDGFCWDFGSDSKRGNALSPRAT